MQIAHVFAQNLSESQLVPSNWLNAIDNGWVAVAMRFLSW